MNNHPPTALCAGTGSNFETIGAAMNLTRITAAIFFAMTCAAQAAPKELYGKSITVSWNETRSQRDGQSGPFQSVSIPFTLVYYVSSEGRLFVRATAKGGSGAGFGSADVAGPGGGNDIRGGRGIEFNGNRIVSNSSFNGAAARHTEISFDANFASCTARVVTAISKGARTAVVRSIATGGNVEFESVSAGPASCSVTAGNPF
jgi:hypothetical protein